MHKKSLTVSALALVAVLAGGAGFAQQAGMGMGAGMGDGMGPGFDFATLDTDKDGKVTKAEVDAFHAAQVKAADANGDGKLSADELATMQISAMTARITARAAKMVELMDTDKDGALSAAELAVPPGPEMMFDKIDANSDGAITQAEIDAAKQSMQQHMGGMDGEGMMGGHGRGHGRGHHDGFWGWFGGDDDAAN
jgi:Ca2+-binding EF-hand superfamily protein